MRFDIEEGNFSDALLEKIGGEDIKKDNNSSPSPPSPASLAPDLMKSDLDFLGFHQKQFGGLFYTNQDKQYSNKISTFQQYTIDLLRNYEIKSLYDGSV